MRYGPIVAKRWRRQYFKRGKWPSYDDWDVQPEDVYAILLELRSKRAIQGLVGKSWVNRLPKKMRSR